MTAQVTEDRAAKSRGHPDRGRLERRRPRRAEPVGTGTGAPLGLGIGQLPPSGAESEDIPPRFDGDSS
ncbi:hypothetical protein [Streptomyces sp. SID12501]|uniref:Uncharacterized protein n=1 Tax=Streptomyces sp. SID12501 TaxID=2706042 RepID=A0A6B3BFH9_9ACTN|nr:hypothetical protein [Streptomyces sp. SID12501]NEC84540.1 hypothetical protein [Streptomyces sp. SID12501]